MNKNEESKNFNSDKTITELYASKMAHQAQLKTLLVAFLNYVNKNTPDQLDFVLKEIQELNDKFFQESFESSSIPQAFASDAIEKLLRELGMK